MAIPRKRELDPYIRIEFESKTSEPGPTVSRSWANCLYIRYDSANRVR
jgi:hypothetical protein